MPIYTSYHKARAGLILAVLTVVLLYPFPRVTAQGQTLLGYVEAAGEAAAKDDFYNAYRLYEIAAEFEDSGNYAANIADIRYNTGLNAYRATAYGVAETNLLLLLALPEAGDYPLTKYYLGQANFRQGDYDQAAAYFQQFLDEQPGAEAAFIASARAQINDADWAIDAMAGAADSSLVHLPEGINTVDSDVMYVEGPSSRRYFSSNHFEFKRDTLVPKRQLSRIMLRTGETTAEALPEEINLPGKNVAHTAFDSDGSHVYYCVCDFRNYDDLRCDIYRAEVGADGAWTQGQKLGINADGYSTTQPSVGLIAGEGREYLFFSSDRPGGKGGMDLYRAPVSEDGTVGEVEALDVLNTPQDDATPFWYAPGQLLYFASDGRFTFGGLDLWRSYYSGGRFRRPINMGHPINSSSDDAYLTRFEQDRAFTASRRPSAEALFYDGQREVCCYEIYQFTPDNRIDLLALTYDRLSSEELAGCMVQLYRITPDGPVLVDEQINTESNEFNFRLDPGEEYELRATKDGYSEALDRFDLSTPEFAGQTFIERSLYLAPTVQLDVFTFNVADGQPLSGVETKLYEMAEDGSLTLVNTQLKNDANDYAFDVELGKRYYIEGTRTDYGQDTALLDLRTYLPDGPDQRLRRDLFIGQALEIYVIDGFTDQPLDSATVVLGRTGGEQIARRTNNEGNGFFYTIDLDRPFVATTSRPGYFTRTDTLIATRQDLVDGGGKVVYYIPLFYLDDQTFEVYFDNDYPNPRTFTRVTQRDYEETYGPYVEKKDLFVEEVIANLSEEAAFDATGNVNQFFEEEVTAGWSQLQRYAAALEQYLAGGGNYVMQLQGFASPRAASEYNMRLSSRRIMSVKNFLRRYGGGVLLPYIDSGQLSFVENPMGESTVDPRISDALDKPQDSVYGIPASLERRVEVGRAIESRK